MVRYIELDTLVAEIQRRIKEHKRYANSNRNNMIEEDVAILSFINSMQEESVPLIKENSTPLSGGKRADSSKQGNSAKKDFRERYKRIAESTEFMSSQDSMSIGDVIPVESEEPVSIWHDASEKPERENLLIETNDGRIIHRQSINNYGMVKKWAYLNDLVNLDNSCNFGKNLQEEPVSNNYSALLPCIYNRTLEERVKYCKYCSAACEGRVKEPVSEDMWEVSKQYALRQVLASTDTKMSEQAYLDLRLFSGLELAVAHKDGAKWQKRKDKEEWLDKALDFFGSNYNSMIDGGVIGVFDDKKKMIEEFVEFMKDDNL